MNTISIDLQPQRTYSELCPLELPIPHALNIVDELNRQANLAHYRVLVKDSHGPGHHPLPLQTQPNQTINRPHAIIGSEGFTLLPGLPDTKNYDFLVHIGIEPDIYCCGACFYDMAENISTGLIEWLQAKKTNRIVIGGLPLEYTVQCTVRQLCWHGDWEVVVNLGACRGFDNVACEQAIRTMREAGATIVSCAAEIANLPTTPNRSYPAETAILIA